MKRFNSDDAFAVYSMPRSRHHTIVWSDDGYWTREDIDLPSFIIQAFDALGLPAIRIPGDHIVHDQPFDIEIQESCPDKSTRKTDYMLCAQETIDAIRRDDFTKVVISKIKRVERGKKRVYDIFMDLKQRYVNTFVFLYHIPGQGLWCGATPEVLVRDHGQLLHTMALAGTQRDMEVDLDAVKWNEKEVYEQYVIESFVEGKMEDSGLQFSKRGPRTVRAGAMLHICTDYYIKGDAHALRVAELLHPGPAICGLPQSLAMEWIHTYENHERLDYCGYVGPWRLEAFDSTASVDSALFINLRSMTIWRDAYLLYLGGGLTAASEAHAEWNETELKASTMLSVIAERTPA